MAPPFYTDDGSSMPSFSFPMSLLVRIATVSTIVASFFQMNTVSVAGAAGLLLCVSLIEAGARVAASVTVVFRNRYTTTKSFREETMEYQWLMAYMVKRGVFKDTKLQTHRAPLDTPWNAPSSKCFLWRGSWVEVTHTGPENTFLPYGARSQPHKYRLEVTFYSFADAPISKLIEEGKRIFENSEHSKRIAVYTLSSESQVPYSNTGMIESVAWSERMYKAAPSFDSTALSSDTLSDLANDAAKFWDSETWFNEIGMPFRKGYLLHGPSGSGKRDAVFAIAGKLGRAVYTLSLKSGMSELKNIYTQSNNAFLIKVMSAIPEGSIFLLENIDECISRPENNDTFNSINCVPTCYGPCCSRQVTSESITPGPTMSGILAMLESMTRQEGVILFATAENMNGIDETLLQPGYIDRAVRFDYVQQERARVLFEQVFPRTITSHAASAPLQYDAYYDDVKSAHYTAHAEMFSTALPTMEFAFADVRSYLVRQRNEGCTPEDATAKVTQWVAMQRTARMCAMELECQKRKEAERKREEHVKYTTQFNPPPSNTSWCYRGNGRRVGRQRLRTPSPAPSMTPSETTTPTVGAEQHSSTE